MAKKRAKARAKNRRTPRSNVGEKAKAPADRRLTSERQIAGTQPTRAPTAAEIVVRQGFVIDATGTGGPHAVPEVVLLANIEGLKFLAGLFAGMAEAARGRAIGNAVVEARLARGEHPINLRMSDDLDFRFAALTDANRRATFKHFGVDIQSRQEGSLFERYQQVATQFGRLTAAMGRDQWRRDHKAQWQDDAAQTLPAVAPHAAMIMAETRTAVPSGHSGRNETAADRVASTMTTATLPSLPAPRPAKPRIAAPSVLRPAEPGGKPAASKPKKPPTARRSEKVQPGKSGEPSQKVARKTPRKSARR